MKKKKALLFTLAVLAIGFAGGWFSGQYSASRKSQAKAKPAEEKIDLKKDLAHIRALQKEITLQTDKAADARGAIMAYEEIKKIPVRLGISAAPYTYAWEESFRRKEYYEANPDKIPFYEEEMGEVMRRNALITSREKQVALEKELKEFVDKKMYIANKQNLNAEAKYWAGRILNDKNITYKELAMNSFQWVGDADLNRELMARVKSYIDAGYVEPWTKEEGENYTRNKDIVTVLLHPGSFDAELINSLSEQDCVNILSRYEELDRQARTLQLSVEEREMVNACNNKMKPDDISRSISRRVKI